MIAPPISVKWEAVLDAAVVMGTSENKSILKNSGMLLQSLKGWRHGLLIGIKARDERD
jgi:hypothetical protein